MTYSKRKTACIYPLYIVTIQRQIKEVEINHGYDNIFMDIYLLLSLQVLNTKGLNGLLVFILKRMAHIIKDDAEYQCRMEMKILNAYHFMQV
jgi:hypothetical protein